MKTLRETRLALTALYNDIGEDDECEFVVSLFTLGAMLCKDHEMSVGETKQMFSAIVTAAYQQEPSDN